MRNGWNSPGEVPVIRAQDSIFVDLMCQRFCYCQTYDFSCELVRVNLPERRSDGDIHEYDRDSNCPTLPVGHFRKQSVILLRNCRHVDGELIHRSSLVIGITHLMTGTLG